MNKFFNKIIGASLAIAMMIGVGVAVNNKEATAVNAETVSGTFEKYSGAITEGDYIVASTTYTLGNTISSNRFTNGRTNLSKNATSITNPDVKEVWHISASGDYWTLFNAATNKYAGSTASKNQGALLDSVTNNAKWTVTGTSTYDFENLARASGKDPSNKWLRNNTTYGWACYATGTGEALTLYKKTAATAQISSVQASVKEGTYYTGSKLKATDFNVVVKWTEGKADTNPTSDFTWTVNDVADGVLKTGNNKVVVTYATVPSSEFNVVGTALAATNVSLNEEQITIDSIGETITLTATVTPENTTDAITWSSSEERVATVDDNGVVTAVAAGSTVITVEVGSVSDTCSVTVLNNEKLFIDFTDGDDYKVVKPSTAQTQITNATIGGWDMNLLNASNNNGVNAFLMLSTKDLKTDSSLVSNKKPVPGAIVKVIFTTTSGASASAKYYGALSTTEITAPVTDNTNSLTGKGSLTITVDASDNYHFFAISSVLSSANGQLASVTVYYEPSTIKGEVEALNTQASLSYTYSAPANNPSAFQNVAIRFGGNISKASWNEVNELYKIEGYGVMLAPTDSLKGDTIEQDFGIVVDLVGGYDDAFETRNNVSYLVDTDIKNFYNPVSTAPYESGNQVIWNLYKGINNTEKGLKKEFTAVAYIKTTYGGVVFFEETSTSAVDLAKAKYAADPKLDETLDGSLSYLASLA